MTSWQIQLINQNRVAAAMSRLASRYTPTRKQYSAPATRGWSSGMDYNTLTDNFRRDLRVSRDSGVGVEPEAQLTIPISNFLRGIAEVSGIGKLNLLREAQLSGVRPDFAAIHNGRPCGWVELKAPGHTLVGSKWTGREARQWGHLKELDALIISEGSKLVLYQLGEQTRTAHLPAEDESWDPSETVELLRLFVSHRPATITRVSQLAKRLAPMAAMLRDRIEAGLEPGKQVKSIVDARAAWVKNVHEGASDNEFANDLAQVIAYAMAIAALRGGADADNDRFLTLSEAQSALRGPNGVLAAALGPVLGIKNLTKDLGSEIGAIERLASVVDAVKVQRSRDRRGEPWLWFYEDFLAAYDPIARKQAGVYYTPTDIVECQVRLVDDILRRDLGRSLSYGDRNVVTLDPATGSGTYPLAVLDRAKIVAEEVRGAAGPRQIAKSLASNLLAFEILPGPYSVAHLRIGQRLAEIAGKLTPPEVVRVYLTDTLDDPVNPISSVGLFGDSAVLAAEREKAAEVKREQPVTIVMGNPPYARGSAESGGGWVSHREDGPSLFDDILKVAKSSGIVFSAIRSLYDDYVYFWRWAIWKAFEQDDTKPAIVSFITASSWLNGPAFVGLRRLARALGDEIWIIDLGGEGRGAVTEENVFAIQTPVAIVTIWRKETTSPQPARIFYRRVRGLDHEKLESLRGIQSPTADPEAWEIVETHSADDSMIPGQVESEWTAMPLLTNIFPWQQPGANIARSWPIASSKDVLKQRWINLLSSEEASERAAKFVTAKTGRNIHTSVKGMSKLSELAAGTTHEPLVRYAYRSFDRQWTFKDPRLAKTESPSLWQSVSSKQIFLATLPTQKLGEGPAMTVAVDVPDFHFFCNRGGKDIIPLYRDNAGEYPNITHGFLKVLSDFYGQSVSAEDLASYVFAIMAHPYYYSVFRKELEYPGPRVPITIDAELFDEAVKLGSKLLNVQTWGERFIAEENSFDSSFTGNIGWVNEVGNIPESPGEIAHLSETNTLKIGDGLVSGVTTEMWNFRVSGFPVLQRWLGSRTRRGVGRAADENRATPLDRIRPTVWEDEWNDELLELLKMLAITTHSWSLQESLLIRILSGNLIDSGCFPVPGDVERQVPKTTTH